MASGEKCTFYGCPKEMPEETATLCEEHRYKEWYTVPEAAFIWHASERSVRDWITRRGIVAAERNGRRPYLIPAVEFTRPHPTQRPRPVEVEPEPMVTLLQEVPDKWYRRLTRLQTVGLALLLVLAATGGALVLAGLLGPASLQGDSPRGQQSPGVFVGETPLSVEFRNWSPDEPVLAMVGEEAELSVAFTNTSPVAGDFYAAVSLKSPEGQWVDVRPLKRVHLEPGAQGEASWQFMPGLVGAWDLVFGVWGHWEDGQEPREPVGNTGLLDGRIVAFQQCIESADSPGLVRIDGYTPFYPVEVTTGAEVDLAITFTNTGNEARAFSAGVTVWRAGQPDTVGGDYRTTTGDPLHAGKAATLRWRHLLEAEGSYQIMFTIWDAQDRVLLRAPCPRQRLLTAISPLSPRITGIEPDQPHRQPARQWISILGRNFNETLAAVLSIQGNRYPIAEERTEFVGPEELRVLVGLTDPGTWTAQVVDAGGVVSNLFEFRVLP